MFLRFVVRCVSMYYIYTACFVQRNLKAGLLVWA